MAVDPNLPIPTTPIGEPTSALTFQDLIIEVAYKAGMAYYGTDGQGPPQVPEDFHDLTLCQRIINKAIRMFINDGPGPNGWYWTRPIAQTDLWPQINYDSASPPRTFVTLTANPTINGTTYAGTTLLTLTTPGVPTTNAQVAPVGVVGTPAFYQSMEYRQIFLNGNPPPNTAGFFIPENGGTANPVACTITRSSTTATVLVPSGTSGWKVGNTVTIASAQQGAYNGNQIITGVTPFSFTYTVAGSPATPATGSITATFLGQVGTPYTILFFVNSTQILVDGDATQNGTVSQVPFSFASSGDYTLPANFGGQYVGDITYIANTNRGMILRWIDESTIRGRRQNYNIESGTPYEAAVRIMPTPSYQQLTNTSGFMLPRRRWELMTWRITSEFLSVLFPYTLAFNDMVNLTDVPPAPFSFDEAIKAACLALVEKELEDSMTGPDWVYYHTIALPAAHRINAMGAPKALGYFGNPTTSSGMQNPIKSFRDQWYQRPTVPVFGRS